MPPTSRRKRSRRQPLDAAQVAIQDSFGPRPRATAPVPLLDEESIERIHNASLTLLENTGMRVLHDKARHIMQAHGASVDESTQMVRFGGDVIEHHLKTTPEKFTLHAQQRIGMGRRTLCLSPWISWPNWQRWCPSLGRT